MSYHHRMEENKNDKLEDKKKVGSRGKKRTVKSQNRFV